MTRSIKHCILLSVRAALEIGNLVLLRTTRLISDGKAVLCKSSREVNSAMQNAIENFRKGIFYKFHYPFDRHFSIAMSRLNLRNAARRGFAVSPVERRVKIPPNRLQRCSELSEKQGPFVRSTGRPP